MASKKDLKERAVATALRAVAKGIRTPRVTSDLPGSTPAPVVIHEGPRAEALFAARLGDIRSAERQARPAAVPPKRVPVPEPGLAAKRLQPHPHRWDEVSYRKAGKGRYAKGDNRFDGWTLTDFPAGTRFHDDGTLDLPQAKPLPEFTVVQNADKLVHFRGGRKVVEERKGNTVLVAKSSLTNKGNPLLTLQADAYMKYDEVQRLSAFLRSWLVHYRHDHENPAGEEV